MSISCVPPPDSCERLLPGFDDSSVTPLSSKTLSSAIPLSTLLSRIALPSSSITESLKKWSNETRGDSEPSSPPSRMSLSPESASIDAAIGTSAIRSDSRTSLSLSGFFPAMGFEGDLRPLSTGEATSTTSLSLSAPVTCGFAGDTSCTPLSLFGFFPDERAAVCGSATTVTSLSLPAAFKGLESLTSLSLSGFFRRPTAGDADELTGPSSRTSLSLPVGWTSGSSNSRIESSSTICTSLSLSGVRPLSGTIFNSKSVSSSSSPGFFSDEGALPGLSDAGGTTIESSLSSNQFSGRLGVGDADDAAFACSLKASSSSSRNDTSSSNFSPKSSFLTLRNGISPLEST